MSEKSFINFIYGTVRQKMYEQQIKIIEKYIDIAKEFIVDFYVSNKYKVLEILKQDGW